MEPQLRVLLVACPMPELEGNAKASRQGAISVMGVEARMRSDTNEKTAANAKTPRCPACRSANLRHEGGDRHRCECGWLCRVVDGVAESYFDPSRRNRAIRSWKRRRGDQ